MTLGSTTDNSPVALGICRVEVKDFGGIYPLVDQQVTSVGLVNLAMPDIDFLKEEAYA